jgi:Eukaryotic-type carbonic anhydrase
LWCPAGDDRCASHHESPINLQRERALRSNDEYNPCIDVHWMQYHDSACSFDQLQAQNGFRIERHALQIVQPIVLNATGQYVLNCQQKGKSWGRIDFSRGFTAWWYLSHIDLHVPSENLQEGKRYDAELQMYHFYSKSGEEAGVDNEVCVCCAFCCISYSSFAYTRLTILVCNLLLDGHIVLLLTSVR